MTTKNKYECLIGANTKLAALFSATDEDQFLTGLCSRKKYLIRHKSKFKHNPIKIPCNILFEVYTTIGFEKQFQKIIFDLQIELFLINNKFFEKEEGPE